MPDDEMTLQQSHELAEDFRLAVDILIARSVTLMESLLDNNPWTIADRWGDVIGQFRELNSIAGQIGLATFDDPHHRP